MNGFTSGVFNGLIKPKVKVDDSKDITEIWKLYQIGEDHHNKASLYTKTDKAHKFFEGDQWDGLQSGGEVLPMFNFIQPTCEYKIAMVALKSMRIEYTNVEYSEILSEMANTLWEISVMDKRMWEIVKEACIAGDAWIYFYDKLYHSQLIDNINIYLADEQQRDIQQQRYVLIYERRPVGDVREDARANGIADDEIELILPDDETHNQAGDAANEVKNQEDGKCSCLLYMRKDENGDVCFTRATKHVVYQPEQAVDGMKVYPVASYVWLPRKGSARGRGEVEGMIPNQIECNRLLARRALSAKVSAFPRPVYSTALANPQDIDRVGIALKVNGSVERVGDAFTYIQPASMSQDAHLLQEELINTTQRMASTGDAALGNVNPEKASGAAIVAARDQAAIPLNEQSAMFRQFIEDVARIWFDMLCAYHPNGLPDGKDGVIPVELLRAGQPEIKVDVEQIDPISRLGREQVMRMDMEAQRITFDEFVEALPEDAVTPKGAYKEMLDRRAMQAQMQAQMMPQMQPMQQGIPAEMPMTI